ncbi:MAG: hypothetical protein WB767_10820, partial [Nocardioides sp.]
TLNMLAENRVPLGEALDAVIAELQAYRRELDDPSALRARVEQAAAGGREMRDASVEWQPTADLAALLSHGRPVLVRSGASGRYDFAELT